jgi:hypothetical protein
MLTVTNKIIDLKIRESPKLGKMLITSETTFTNQDASVCRCSARKYLH